MGVAQGNRATLAVRLTDPTPQEVAWTVRLDEDEQHATYDADQVATYFEAATQAALVLAEFRAPFRGRSKIMPRFMSNSTALSTTAATKSRSASPLLMLVAD